MLFDRIVECATLSNVPLWAGDASQGETQARQLTTFGKRPSYNNVGSLGRQSCQRAAATSVRLQRERVPRIALPGADKKVFKDEAAVRSPQWIVANKARDRLGRRLGFYLDEVIKCAAVGAFKAWQLGWHDELAFYAILYLVTPAVPG